ncbi:MAG: formate dehydrogenase accessory sulfurtransferase FdhD [Bacillota bacterium]
MPATRPPHAMPSERRTRLVLNGSELLRIQTTPVALDDWATGFLFTEGMINQLGDLQRLEVDAASGQVVAEVNPDGLPDQAMAGKRYLTSGCGKGVTFSSIKDVMGLQPVRHPLRVDRVQLVAWIKWMQRQTPLYEESGGMHAAAVSHVPSGEMLVREDIGRHNAVDKAIGAALKAGFPAEELVLLTTGRISYEMCSKMARAGIGIGASLTAATDQAIRLAERLQIDLVGYVRSPEKLVIYTRGTRIG